MPKLSPNDHLELAIRGAIAEVQGRNDAMTTCYDVMKKQAKVFAATMTEASMPVEHMFSRVEVPGAARGFWIQRQVYQDVRVPLWHITAAQALIRPHHTPQTEEAWGDYNLGEFPTLSITTGGKIKHVEGFYVDNSDTHDPQELFLNRETFDNNRATEQILGRWVLDLKMAAEHYARKT